MPSNVVTLMTWKAQWRRRLLGWLLCLDRRIFLSLCTTKIALEAIALRFCVSLLLCLCNIRGFHVSSTGRQKHLFCIGHHLAYTGNLPFHTGHCPFVLGQGS